MSVRIETATPNSLLSSIKREIADKKIETWLVDADGDFTHEPEQWRYKAWLRPSIGDGCLKLILLGRKGESMSKAIYAVYHGRFIEMVLTHFDESCTSASASAFPSEGDSI